MKRGDRRLVVKFTRKGQTVTAQVTEMPESLRGKQMIAHSGEYEIKSIAHPELVDEWLYLCGTIRRRDQRVVRDNYDSARSAITVVARFRRLIAKINADLEKKAKVRK